MQCTFLSNGSRAHYIMVSKIQWKPFLLPPSSNHRIAGLGGKIVWTMAYAHRPRVIWCLLDDNLWMVTKYAFLFSRLRKRKPRLLHDSPSAEWFRLVGTPVRCLQDCNGRQTAAVCKARQAQRHSSKINHDRDLVRKSGPISTWKVIPREQILEYPWVNSQEWNFLMENPHVEWFSWGKAHEENIPCDFFF